MIKLSTLTGERSFTYDNLMDGTYQNKIADFYARHRRMPSYAEIMKLVGFKSKNAVSKLIDRLEQSGFIERDSTGKLIPQNIFGEIKKLGVVEAGFPTLAEEDTSDSISLDQLLIKNKDSTYMLTVKGDSMIDAGIHNGDMVIAERNNNPNPGDIVIAEVDGGWTMKYFRRSGNRVYLDPANKNFDSIIPKEDLKIEAVVKAVIRTYK
ncbi:MAG: transcriptional repressor LexA [Patescibacteria group bacterium]